ncbi:uncharacterized protein BXZ73DRAFT_44092 [Epithele typhae]|uniref:uncharacterized protein n=1 Tax=Epithele typhae TaxID=378194 RepID=UPI0020072AF5|nr:uncharacterized protein BXZ73DRAFT_44092 [Epithele typhae]KAH9939035.1 hypothetical protein BXZ73DRAFT_44092 [Epithele typhae]
MADARARAEARRKAILARGSDRLSRITTSARGEDGAAYMHDPAPLPGRAGLTDFVGETSNMPTPPLAPRAASMPAPSATSPFQAAGLGAAPPDPSVWSEEQQQQFMSALLGAAASGRFPTDLNSSASASTHSLPAPRPRVASSASSTAGSTTVVADPPEASLPADDPMSALMAALGGGNGGGGAPPAFPFPGAGMMPPQMAPPKPKTLLQRLMPLVHVVCAWVLLTYFVLWKEPEAYEIKTHGTSAMEGLWSRWADLSWKAPDDGWGVQAVPFFWAFTTLALVLHTWRIFTNLDPVQPPMLLALALPVLPPPLPAVITNGLKYLQIGGVFLDDMSALLVGIGMLIWVATWFAT